jgi:hypothetical protein
VKIVIFLFIRRYLNTYSKNEHINMLSIHEWKVHAFVLYILFEISLPSQLELIWLKSFYVERH